jgi:hypothetical protein
MAEALRCMCFAVMMQGLEKKYSAAVANYLYGKICSVAQEFL